MYFGKLFLYVLPAARIRFFSRSNWYSLFCALPFRQQTCRKAAEKWDYSRKMGLQIRNICSMARPAKMTICLLCGFLLHAISARALFKSVCKPLIGGGKGLRLEAFCLLEGNDAIRVIDPDHTGVLRRSFRFHFSSPLHIRFMIFIKACRLLPGRRQTSRLRRFSPRAAHSVQIPSSAAAVDQSARSG